MILPSVEAKQAPSQQTKLRALIGTIGFAIAIAVSLAGPVIYGVTSIHERGEILEFKAALNADRVAKYVYEHGRLWQYQQARLSELIELPVTDAGESRLRVIDGTGKTVVEDGPMLSQPMLRRQAAIEVNGSDVGHVEIAESLWPVLPALVSITLASLALGMGAYMAFRVLPVRMLDRTLGALETQNQRFDAAISNMSEGLCMFDANKRLLVSNPQYAHIYGLEPGRIKPGTTIRDILEKRASVGLYVGADKSSYIRHRLAATDDCDRKPFLQTLNDGRIISVKSRSIAGGGWVSTHEDVTEQKRAQERIAYLAHHDSLTDLANRTLFGEHLASKIHDPSRSKKLAILCLDLDRFKDVNDTLGHTYGDALLKVVASRLVGCVRETDVVARLGGDEFAILQVDGEQPEDAMALASRLLELVGSPFELDGHHVTVGTSIGVAVAPTDGTDANELLRNADLALYRSKADGRGAYRFFEPEMDRRAQARRKLEADLRNALRSGEFELHYQPLVSLESNEINGFEALIRWNHPERGRIPPVEFIPLAEEIGLIVPIGEWVLRQACLEAAKWPAPIKVSVNVSAIQFKTKALSVVIISALAAAGLAPSRLEIEITESVMLEDPDAVFVVLTRLHDLGIRVALDDFGTGYSALSNLRRFPFDRIKIDRSFITDLSADNVDAISVLRSVAQLGISLGMATTAEGVESKEQLELIRAEGCTDIQGYYISKPVPASAIAALLVAQIASPNAAGAQQMSPRVVSYPKALNKSA